MSNTLDVTILLGQSPVYNRIILKVLKASSQKWFIGNHIQTALSKLSVKKLERTWEGWEAKHEHVEAITRCRWDWLAFGLPCASKLLSNQPSLFPQSNNPIIPPPQLTVKPSWASQCCFLCASLVGKGKYVWILIQTVTCLPRPKRKSHMEM